MQPLVVTILGWIALTDARTHRIPNRELLILVTASVVTLNFEDYSVRNHVHISIVVIFIAIFLAYFCGLGVGDVKLIAVLSFFVLPPYFTSYRIFLLTVAVTASAHALFLSRGDLRKSLQIPLAPAILCGTIATLIAK